MLSSTPPPPLSHIQLKDVIFSVEDVFDVLVKEELYGRPQAAAKAGSESKSSSGTASYGDLWRAEMGDSEPEPLAEQLKKRDEHRDGVPGAPQGMAAGGKKGKGKGKRKKKGKAGKQGEQEGGAEL